VSRIHEALQRAAQSDPSPDAPGEGGNAPLLEEQDIHTLAREGFPVEFAEVRRARPTPEPPPREEAPSEPPADTTGGTRTRPAKSLFERIDARLAEKVVVDADMSPVSREQYRRLAAVLHDAQGNNGLRVVMVTSAMPGEGKTLTATNLALTLSDSYRRRVLLIDADLRRPALHDVFRLSTTSGLIDGLESPEVKLVLRQVSPFLSILPAGRPTADPMAGLTSDRMRRLLDEAKEMFDWVIIDTPPLMLLPDAHLLSFLIDGAVLVVKANSTPHELVRRTAETIGRDRVLGVVLNRAEHHAHPSYSNYGHYYGHYLPPKPDLAKP
jgi:capsular exopolysaccharide synthesis family protein